MGQLILDVDIAMLGAEQVLSEGDVQNWEEATQLLTTTPCDFSLSYDGETYEGIISKSTDGLKLLVLFDDEYVIFPEDMCLDITCEDADDTECPNNLQQLDDDTKLSVLDDDGCAIGFVTFAQIKEAIIDDLDIPTSLCDLIGSDIPSGGLVASDRILTTSGECTLKSVSQVDIACE